MTMDEITKLVDDFGRVSAVEGDADPPHSEAWIESRAALLRAVEALEMEAAKADSWRQAAEGFRRERDEAMASDAESIAMYRRARDRAEAAEAERDRLLEERDAANATAQRIALTAAGYVGALLAGGPDVVTVSAQRLVEARLPRVEARPGGGVRFTLTDTTLGEALDRIGSASPPPAALSTETEAAPAENVRAACGHITADRGAHPLRCDVCAPTPTKSKEDPHHG